MIVGAGRSYKIRINGDYELMQETTNPPIFKSKIELDKKAVALALDGEWENAAACNRAILDHYPSDVETMNRLAKSLIELNQFSEARSLLGRVIEISPYNTIAKKTWYVWINLKLPLILNNISTLRIGMPTSLWDKAENQVPRHYITWLQNLCWRQSPPVNRFRLKSIKTL